jgi:hypothetical protein
MDAFGDPPRVSVTARQAPLPQPGWRLLGFASVGLGAGLFSAESPFLVLAAAFLPACIALIVIALQSDPVGEEAITWRTSATADELVAKEDHHG